jgi:uncharacterized membrane protein YphA (DoxX/SURF4 family)
MSLSAKIRHAPVRVATGAFILNAGISKFNADDDTSKSLHGMASGSFPLVEKMDHKVFVKALSVGEIALGSALLLPMVSPVVAGLGLTAFAGSLLTVWWRTPGMHEEHSIRPTTQGTPIAKDVWMLGAGLSLVLDGLLEPAHDKKIAVAATVTEKAATKRRQARKARKAAALAAAASAAQLGERVRDVQTDLGARGRAASHRAAEQARELADRRHEFSDKAADLAGKTSGKASDLAGKTSGKASDLAGKTSGKASELASDLAGKTSGKASEIAARASELAGKASEAAEKIADVATEKAHELAERLPSR